MIKQGKNREYPESDRDYPEPCHLEPARVQTTHCCHRGFSKSPDALANSQTTESTVLLEDPETLDAELQQGEEAEAEAEAEMGQPGLTMFTGRSRLEDGGNMEERPIRGGYKTHMGYNQEAYDAECAAVAKGAGVRFPKANDPGTGHDLHGRPSRHQANDHGGAGPRPAVRTPSEEAYRHAAEGEARHHHRDSVAPGPQGSRRQRKEWAKLSG